MQYIAPTRNAAMRAADLPADKEPLQVRIPASVKRRFKAHAALRGMAANELFMEVWESYEQRHTDASGQGSPDAGR